MQPLAQDWFSRANQPSLDVLAGMVFKPSVDGWLGGVPGAVCGVHPLNRGAVECWTMTLDVFWLHAIETSSLESQEDAPGLTRANWPIERRPSLLGHN